MTKPYTITFRTTAMLLGLLAVLALAACGGSSTKSTTTGTGAAATATTPAPGSEPGTPTVTTPKTAPSATAVAYRKCLEAHGAGLPHLVLGPGKSVALGHLAPPKGVSKSTYENAVKACGGAIGTGKSKVSKAVDAFVECMRENGVKVPKPGTGKGLFSYLGDVKNPKFGTAMRKCAGLLTAATGGGAAK